MKNPSLKIIVNDSFKMKTINISILQTIPQHLRELAKNLRKEDAAEILALGISPEKALWRSYKNSVYRKTAIINGKVAACWGVCGQMFGSYGIVWLLTSDAVKEISPLKFARLYQKEVNTMLQIFPEMGNYVDSRYSSAIRLLEIVGFNVNKQKERVGESGELFRKFKIERS